MTDDYTPLDFGLMNENERGRIVKGVWTATQFIEMRDAGQDPGDGDMLLMLEVELHLSNGLVVHVMIPEPLLSGLIVSAAGVWQARFPNTGPVSAEVTDEDLNQLLDPDRKHDND